MSSGIFLNRIFVFITAFAVSLSANAAAVEPQTLDELTAEADVVLKVTAIKTESVEDAWFTPASMLGAGATRFKVISRLKGEFPGEEASFHHYVDLNNSPLRYFPTAPLLRYKFWPGQNYLLWADKTADGNLRQLSKDFMGHFSQGVIRVGDDAAVQGEVKNVVWDELIKGTRSSKAAIVRGAIGQLGAMSRITSNPSGSSINYKPDFPLERFVEAVIPLFHSPDEHIAFSAIVAVSGKSSRTAKDELLKIADTHPKLALRGMALGNLRGLKTPEVEEAAHRALQNVPPETNTDDAAVLQDCALSLLADFPGARSRFAWRAYAAHPARRVRAAVATAIGEAKEGALAWLLGKMVDDPVQEVRYAAVRSLLILPPDLATATWKKRCTPDYCGQFFVNALAARNVEPYLPALVNILNNPVRPKTGVEILDKSPDYTSSQLVFDYVGKKPKSTLESAALAPILNALEESRWISSKFEMLYRFYRTTKMEKRARTFRARWGNNLAYAQDAFNRVDRELAAK